MRKNENKKEDNILSMSSEGYMVDREMSQPLFAEFFERYGLDSYGNPDMQSPLSGTGRMEGKAHISAETDVFFIHPYYWGDDEAAADMPNFLYKPEDIEIRWYKYPMRGAYSNVKLSKEKLKQILHECRKSIRKAGER